MKNQPSPLDRTSVTKIGSDRADVRAFAAEVVLIRNWVQTIRQCAMVMAHGTLGGQLPDVDELLGRLEAIETAILTGVNEGAALLDRLADWEASLLHVALEVPPTHCLVCERAKTIPADMPADYAWALRVVDDAA